MEPPTSPLVGDQLLDAVTVAMVALHERYQRPTFRSPRNRC
jgi:hypothetical protein